MIAMTFTTKIASAYSNAFLESMLIKAATKVIAKAIAKEGVEGAMKAMALPLEALMMETTLMKRRQICGWMG